MCVCWGGGGEVQAIIRGRQLVEQRLLFEEIRYFYLFARTWQERKYYQSLLAEVSFLPRCERPLLGEQERYWVLFENRKN